MNVSRILGLFPRVLLVALLSAVVLRLPAAMSASAAAATGVAPQPQRADARSLWDEGEGLRFGPEDEKALAIFQRIAREQATTQFAQPAQLRAAELLSALRRPDEALAAYKRVESFPHSDWYGADWAGSARYQAAGLLEREGRIEEAIAAYHWASDPKSKWRDFALRDLGALCRRQRRYKEALQAYLDLAHTSAWCTPQGLWGMACTYQESGQTDKFIKQCDKMARLYPKSLLTAEVLLGEADLYRAQRRTALAIATYYRVAVLFTGMREGKTALWEAGRLLEECGSRFGAADAYRRLLRWYYPESPTGGGAAERLVAMGFSAPRCAGRDRRVLIDETHGEARTYDVAYDGSGMWYGQREVLTGLMKARYVPHVLQGDDAPYPPPPVFAQVDLSRYAAVIINGGQQGVPLPFSPDEVEDLTEYVRRGGALLVASGAQPDWLNGLLGAFGIGFGPAKSGWESCRAVPVSAEDRAALPFLPKEVYVAQETQVTGKPDLMLVHLDGSPLIAAVKHGKGIVVAAAVGHGFMGTGLSPVYCKAHAVNLKFLVDLVAWMVQQSGPD